MLPTERIIKEISEVMAAGKGGEPPVSALANDYAAFCHDANQRLAQCIAMIEKGNDYQALQLAETEPNLMDLVGGLSFGGSLAWRDFCANNALTVPERLDAKYVKALNALYAKGISANHPLYKDYRAAVMERKDEKAIQIIRTITRVNPSDANAKMELERLLNKLFQAKLAELKGALLNNDEGATVGLVDEIETIAPPAKLAPFREYAQAKDVRWAFRRRLIFGELRVAAGRLEEVRALGTWQEVGGTLEKVQRLQIEKPFDPTEEEQALLAATRKFHDQEQERSAQETRFRNALGALGEQVERAEVRIANRSAATLRLVEVEYLTLSKRWQEVERFSKPIPEDLQARVRRNASILKTEMERLKKQRRMLVAMVVTGLVVIAGVASWFTFQSFQAGDYSAQLSKAQQAGQVGVAEKLIASLSTDKKNLANSPSLSAKIAETDTWAKEERRKRAETDRQVSELEALAAQDFSNTDPRTISTKLQIAANGVSSLAVDLKSQPEARLSVIQNKFDARLASMRTANQEEIEKLLQDAESLAGNGLTFDTPVQQVQQTIQRIEPDIQKIDVLSNTGIDELKLPEALEARIEAVRKRVTTFKKEIDKLSSVQVDMERSVSLDAYRHALEEYRDSQFVQSDMVARARKLLSDFPDPDHLLMSMLLPGDPATWAAAKTDHNTSFIATDVFPAELSKLLALRDNNDLKDIWQISFGDSGKGGGRGVIYSRGKIRQTIADEAISTYSGIFYDTAKSPDVVSFGESSLSLDASKLSEVLKASSGSVALGNLNLNYLIDDSGTKYQTPLLKLLDDLVGQKDAPPLFKAFVMRRLQELINVRPYAWGVQWCPSLRKDFATLAKLDQDDPVRSSDWMVPRRNRELGPKFATFFDSISGHSYLREAIVIRELVTTIFGDGLVFAGYVGADGTPKIVPEAAGNELWTTGSDGEGPVCFKPKKSDSKFEPVESVAPFMPLFYVRADRAELLADACKKYSVGSNLADLQAALPPFFTMTSK